MELLRWCDGPCRAILRRSLGRPALNCRATMSKGKVHRARLFGASIECISSRSPLNFELKVIESISGTEHNRLS